MILSYLHNIWRVSHYSSYICIAVLYNYFPGYIFRMFLTNVSALHVQLFANGYPAMFLVEPCWQCLWNQYECQFFPQITWLHSSSCSWRQICKHSQILVYPWQLLLPMHASLCNSITSLQPFLKTTAVTWKIRKNLRSFKYKLYEGHFNCNINYTHHTHLNENSIYMRVWCYLCLCVLSHI